MACISEIRDYEEEAFKDISDALCNAADELAETLKAIKSVIAKPKVQHNTPYKSSYKLRFF